MGPAGVSAGFVQSEGSEFHVGQHTPKWERKFASRTFSLHMVSITSSGGVPSSSVIIENWFTSTFTTLRGVEQSWAARRTILSRKEGLAFKHLGENASRAPNVDGNIVFLPREHDLGSPIITRRHVAGHLRILYSGKTKVTYLGCCAVSQRKAGRERVLTLRSQFSFTRMLLGFYGTDIRVV